MGLAEAFPSLKYFFIVAVLIGTACSQKSTPHNAFKDVDFKVRSLDSHQIVDISKKGELDDAPDFTFITVQGEEFKLSAHKGKVIAVNFWGLWCPPCLAEIPEFIALQEELGYEEVLFIGVASMADSLSEIKEYIRKTELNYPVIQDDGRITELYYPSGWPSTYLINKEGKLSHLILGATNKRLLQPVLEKLIEEEI